VNKLETFQRLKEAGIVSVMRRMKPDSVIQTVNVLKQAGIVVVEITVEHPDGFTCIKRLKEENQDNLLLGAGTVLDAEAAKHAIDSGADFLVTPVVKADVITIANRCGLLVAAGAMTPTEILTAYELGADLVKVFPADSLGPSYLKYIKGPLQHIPLMPTGGIDQENMTAYFQNGAVCVGIGSALYQYDSLVEIEQAAAQFMKVYRLMQR
jgi:2-dehydro-3-deoxyphosphogluconate aldolase / (4S)-4-hydroxy-2-oxoglutarate aldolase